MKSSVTHLQNPYKSQFSYCETNQNPFNSVSYEDYFKKCFQTNCYIKYKCVTLYNEQIIRRLDESSFDSKGICNENEHENCLMEMSQNCRKICPIDCLKDTHFFYKLYNIS